MLTLREDQQAVMAELRAALRSHRSVLVQCATGWGKTALASVVALGAAQKRRRAIFCVHRIELIEQTSRTFNRVGLPHGFVAGGMAPDPLATVQIACAPSLGTRLDRYPADLLVIDEGHLYAGGQRAAIIAHYRDAGAKIIVLTATPQRLDGKPMRGIADHMINGPSVAWLMANGILSTYRAFAPSSADLVGLHHRGGDFIQGELTERLDRPSIIGDAVASWQRLAAGKRTIVFAFSRDHGKHVAATYQAAGINAVYLDGETSREDRRERIERFAAGQAPILVNIQLCTEGFDLAAQVGREVPIEAAQFLRPTESLPLALQMMGRALRMKAEPAILLDHVRLFEKHGLPDDARAWSLDAADTDPNKALIAPASSTCTCAHCAGVFRPAAVCPYCGTPREVDGRHVFQLEGELEEINPDLTRLAREMARAKKEAKAEEQACRTLADWGRLAQKRGYQAGWARRQFQIRRDYAQRFAR